MPTLTSSYPLESLAVGQYFTVYNRARFQHARVAASEYGRRHSRAYSCRIQEDGRTMRVYRVADNQMRVDQRGAVGRRLLPDVPRSIVEPTRAQFLEWLASFAPGQSYAMPVSYSAMYVNMVQWCLEYTNQTNILVTAGLWHDRTLMIHRLV